MKTLTIVGSLLLFTLTAVAQGQINIAQAHDMSFLTNGDQSQTPYQKLEALFNSAKPMRLGQFPTPQSPDLKNWYCSNLVQTQATPATIGAPSNTVPALVTGTVGGGTPGDGPLFPAQPAQTVIEIIFIANDGSFNMTPTQIGADYTSGQTDLVPYPDVSEKYLYQQNDPNSWVTDTYRSINNLIVLKQKATDTNVYGASNDGYAYCWKQ